MYNVFNLCIFFLTIVKFIKHNLVKLRQKISNVCRIHNRDPKDIKLVAVSKNKSVYYIHEALNNNQIDFGENYVQEGMKKIFLLKKNKEITWHFIGKLQSNKSKLVATYFNWCHTVDRISIANKLNKYRPQHLQPLNVLIQINFDNEKIFAISSNSVPNLISHIITLPNLKMRGFMAVMKPNRNVKKNYKIISDIFIAYKNKYTFFDTLSLGMSNDLELAIQSGSTLLRIGTDIFGKR